jgi:hypothetical protein
MNGKNANKRRRVEDDGDELEHREEEPDGQPGTDEPQTNVTLAKVCIYTA